MWTNLFQRKGLPLEYLQRQHSYPSRFSRGRPHHRFGQIGARARRSHLFAVYCINPVSGLQSKAQAALRISWRLCPPLTIRVVNSASSIVRARRTAVRRLHPGVAGSRSPDQALRVARSAFQVGRRPSAGPEPIRKSFGTGENADMLHSKGEQGKSWLSTCRASCSRPRPIEHRKTAPRRIMAQQRRRQRLLGLANRMTCLLGTIPRVNVRVCPSFRSQMRRGGGGWRGSRI